MITKFKIFEKKEIDENIKHTFIIDEVAQYYLNKYGDDAEIKMKDFLSSIFDLRNVKVAFECERCTYDNEYGATSFAHAQKFHSGVIRGMGYGVEFYDGRLLVNLNVSLERIKYRHEVNTKGLFFIIGKIPQSFEKILDDFELYKNTKKYNL